MTIRHATRSGLPMSTAAHRGRRRTPCQDYRGLMPGQNGGNGAEAATSRIARQHDSTPDQPLHSIGAHSRIGSSAQAAQTQSP
jgi:hypothetical protein